MNGSRKFLVLGSLLLVCGFSAWAYGPIADTVEASGIVFMEAPLFPTGGPIIADGEFAFAEWQTGYGAYDQLLEARIRVFIGSGPGFGTFDEAMNADVRIHIGRYGVVHSECLLKAEPITSRSSVYYKLKIHSSWAFPTNASADTDIGVCDVNLGVAGVQPGMPHMHPRDYITVDVAGESESARQRGLLYGWCE